MKTSQFNFTTAARKTADGEAIRAKITNSGYFSITGSITKNGRDVAGGCIHDEIARYFPELAPFIKWHLTNADGLPMHYVANTVYFARQYAEGEDPTGNEKAADCALWPELAEMLASDAAGTIATLPDQLEHRKGALISDFTRDMQRVENLRKSLTTKSDDTPPATLAEILEPAGFTFKVERIPSRTDGTDWGNQTIRVYYRHSAHELPGTHWRYTLSHPDGGAMSGEYTKGCGVSWARRKGGEPISGGYGRKPVDLNGPPVIIPPTLTDILECLLSDAEMIESGDFEEFCELIGKDTDSKSATEQYLSMQKTARDLRRVLGPFYSQLTRD